MPTHRRGLLLSLLLASPAVMAQAVSPAQGPATRPATPGSSAVSSQPAPAPVASTSSTPNALTAPPDSSAPAGAASGSPALAAPIPAQTATPPDSSATPLAVASPPEPDDDAPRTLLGGDKMVFGGYGGVHVNGSSMFGRGIVYVGGEGAVLLDHRLALGGAGYGMATRVHVPGQSYAGLSQRMEFGYGGVVVRYSLLFDQPYYVTPGLLVGAGGVSYILEYDNEWNDSHTVDSGAVLVVEPSLAVHANVTRWLRLMAQLSYRAVSGLDGSYGLNNRDLSGLAFGGGVEAGWL